MMLLVVLTCITEVMGFYDVFGSSYLYHRGLGVSDDVFASSYLHHRGLWVSDDVFGSSS